MFPKVDFRQIVRDHLKTLVNANTNKPDFSDWATFFVLPIIGASVLVYAGILLNGSTIGIIISALAIFVGLLLNLVVILFDITKSKKLGEHGIEVGRETISNISFSILISFFGIGLVLLTQCSENEWYKKCSNFIAFFFLFEFMLTLLMVLKRMYLLFFMQIQELKKEK